MESNTSYLFWQHSKRANFDIELLELFKRPRDKKNEYRISILYDSSSVGNMIWRNTPRNHEIE